MAEKIRDENIFENIPCVVAYVNRRHNLSSSHVGHDDHWGEPDPLIDFSVEEILDMPTVCDVQPDPTPKVTDSDLKSEDDNPKMDSEQFSVNLPTTDDLELINIESLFIDDTDDRPVLSQDEAWELFS